MALASVIDRAIEHIADGAPIDWPALESGVQSDEEREVLRALRILGGVAELHRSTTDDTSGSRDETIEDTAGRPAGGQADERSDLWGRYRLLQKVGEGSFGSVYRAWDPELEREIAIKILHRRLASADLKRRLLREGRALAKIRHNNVVSVLAVESHKDRVGLCMEFVRGQTLEAELRTRLVLTAREAALAGEEVCEALAAVHQAGFVHRDVKARNVMRDQGGRIVLMDFGTGREVERAARSGGVETAGTPVYMAPEVLAGEPATPRSDVYSVGVLLYHLVTGEYPVVGRTMDDLRAAHEQGRRVLLGDRRTDLPLRFIHVVEQALALNPQKRYASATALLEALARISGSRSRALTWYLSRAGVALAGIFTGFVLLGMLSSRVFNTSVGRSDFAHEGVGDWLYWGASSCLGPAILLVIALTAVGLAGVLRKLLLSVSAGARTLDSAAQRHIGAVAHRLRLDDVSVLAAAVLLLSASSFVVAWWYFSPLFEALLMDATTASADALRLLAPGAGGSLNEYKVNYRKTFSWIAVISALSWYLTLRMASRKRVSLHWGVLAGGAAVLVLALGVLDFPFRLINRWNQFDAARWQGNDCYILGERGEDVLLFCPALQPSRRRIVKKDDTLERTGVRENVFTRFAENTAGRE